jgi:hypothetical protein
VSSAAAVASAAASDAWSANVCATPASRRGRTAGPARGQAQPQPSGERRRAPPRSRDRAAHGVVPASGQGHQTDAAITCRGALGDRRVEGLPQRRLKERGAALQGGHRRPLRRHGRPYPAPPGAAALRRRRRRQRRAAPLRRPARHRPSWSGRDGRRLCSPTRISAGRLASAPMRTTAAASPGWPAPRHSGRWLRTGAPTVSPGIALSEP